MNNNKHKRFDIANLATALGFISTFKFGPIDLYRSILSSLSVIILDSQLFLGIVLGALTCVTFAAVASALRHAMRGRNGIVKYDPASPPDSPALRDRTVSWHEKTIRY